MSLLFLDVPSRLAARPLHMLKQCADSLVAYWMRRAAIKQLQQLDNRQLRDIGLSRCGIEVAAHGLERPDANAGRLDGRSYTRLFPETFCKQDQRKGILHMLPFLHFHAIAAGRGDGLHPKFRALLGSSATSPCDMAVRPDGMLQAGPDPVSIKVGYAGGGAGASLQPSPLLTRHLRRREVELMALHIGVDRSQTESVLIDDALRNGLRR
jgi:uncharacterized protein YjiS (DUF1127 family)